MLTQAERAYRSGYIASQNESAKVFMKENPTYIGKRKRAQLDADLGARSRLRKSGEDFYR